ncbi:hypothetical protein K0M31_010188 [Melipona bicolor]|uniref:Uncharacterized protein n=1 Tax=Melipona bicolor TaxID=60889 RepID=A0AA40KI85_9HYME|nr:hypothetical protein K0M31_010188 [Melipona bicolor]
MLLSQRSPSPPHEETRVIDRHRERSTTRGTVQDRQTELLPSRGSPKSSNDTASSSSRFFHKHLTTILTTYVAVCARSSAIDRDPRPLDFAAVFVVRGNARSQEDTHRGSTLIASGSGQSMMSETIGEERPLNDGDRSVDGGQTSIVAFYNRVVETTR